LSCLSNGVYYGLKYRIFVKGVTPRVSGRKHLPNIVLTRAVETICIS
jgi:hypothetical protein